MKENFPQQISGYDCLPKAFESALIAVFGRGYVPLLAVKAIYKYSMDTEGTSKIATEKIATKLSEIPEIYIKKLTGRKASPKGIFDELKMGHSVVVPTWYEYKDKFYRHAVAAIAIKGKNICIFDPESSHRTETLQSLRLRVNKKSFLPIVIGKALLYE